MLNEVVPGADLDAAVDRWVQGVLACAPLALLAIKHMVQHNTTHMSPREAQSFPTPALVAALRSLDADGSAGLPGEATAGLEGRVNGR